MASSGSASDNRAIRDLIENWAIWRDGLMWDKFRTVWHKEGVMNATWVQAPFEDFIAANKKAYERGIIILHFLGGMNVEVKGKRAITQTKMTIAQRLDADGVMCDVVCTGRFYDFLEKRRGKWGMVVRQPIYERDRLNPVDVTQTPKLDKKLLNSFPEGYRHLAYLQTKAGYKVKPNMPGIDGPVVEALYAAGEKWLKGKKLDQSWVTMGLK
ncbi:MAG TPA: nuclear transport factor 2 family protein [Xanthobacteraceae bacterium]|nr:nuclear transport factor 2 family protein [Xanthobacteraceae bacterium]